MSGKPINQQQVKLYMSYRKQPNQTQLSAASKAGFSERSARHIDKGVARSSPHVGIMACSKWIPLNVLQELGGWKSAEMVRRYAHLGQTHLANYSENSSQLE